MKKIFVLSFYLLICYALNAQNSRSERKTRKAANDKEMIMDFNFLGAIIESKSFVLEFENLLYPSYNKKLINPLLNFIMVDSSSCVWQSEASDIPTDLFRTVSKVEGKIDGWKLEKDDKRLRYFLQFRMFTDNGLFRVTLSLHPDKTISGNINSVRDTFNFTGRIVSR